MAIAGSAVPSVKLEKIGEGEFIIDWRGMCQRGLLPPQMSLESTMNALRGEQPEQGYYVAAQFLYQLGLRGFDIKERGKQT